MLNEIAFLGRFKVIKAIGERWIVLKERELFSFKEKKRFYINEKKNTR